MSGEEGAEGWMDLDLDLDLGFVVDVQCKGGDAWSCRQEEGFELGVCCSLFDIRCLMSGGGKDAG